MRCQLCRETPANYVLMNRIKSTGAGRFGPANCAEPTWNRRAQPGVPRTPFSPDAPVMPSRPATPFAAVVGGLIEIRHDYRRSRPPGAAAATGAARTGGTAGGACRGAARPARAAADRSFAAITAVAAKNRENATWGPGTAGAARAALSPGVVPLAPVPP